MGVVVSACLFDYMRWCYFLDGTWKEGILTIGPLECFGTDPLAKYK